MFLPILIIKKHERLINVIFPSIWFIYEVLIKKIENKKSNFNNYNDYR